MCFSANASFVASAILAVVGVASIKKTRIPSQVMFACIPIIFSFQQFTEGFVWIALISDHHKGWHNVPVYTFIFFAQVLWLIWVPISFFLMEKNVKRKRVLFILVVIGSTISLYHLYCMLSFDVRASITQYHIHYDLDFPLRHNFILDVLYLLCIIAPSIFSSIKKMHILGILLLFSFLISRIFFKDYIISVWCFFAALISAVVFLIMKNLKEEDSLTEIFPRLQSKIKYKK